MTLNLKGALSWLQGRKTYIGLIAVLVIGISGTEGWISGDTAVQLGLLVGVLTGVSAKASQNRIETKVDQTAKLSQLVETLIAEKRKPQ